MEVLELLIAAGFGAAVTGLFTIIKWKLDRKATKEDRKEDDAQDACRKRGEDLQKLQNQVNDLITASRIQFYCTIKQRCKKYIARKFITSDELEDLLEEHSVYHNELGGNGFLDELMAQVKLLTIRNGCE